jgi:hypothetical protein
MFHELYATGPVTSSALWLSPIMRVVARQLADVSQHVLTNREASAQWLGSRATALPVFSSLGEIDRRDSIAEREPWLAVFGYQARRRRSYWERLRRTIDALRPTRVIALGRIAEGVKEACGTIPCEETGALPAGDVSGWLARCRYGYLSYAPAFLGKSSILAAYLAHGLCTVLADDAKGLPEGLRLGHEVLSATDLNGDSDCESVAALGARWYRPHNRTATADLYAQRLQDMVRRTP